MSEMSEKKTFCVVDGFSSGRLLAEAFHRDGHHLIHI